MTYETTIVDDYGDPEEHGLFLPIKTAYSLYGFHINTIEIHYPATAKPSHRISVSTLFSEIAIMAKILRYDSQEAYWFIRAIFKL